jgi:hypothetical protein
MVRAFRGYSPNLLVAPQEYDQQDESIFRRGIEQQLDQIVSHMVNMESMNTKIGSSSVYRLNFMLMGG